MTVENNIRKNINSSEEMSRFMNERKRELPDVVKNNKAIIGGTLERVGMQNIKIPLRFANEHQQTILVPSKINGFVSLDDPKAKGIHMSRLMRIMTEQFESKPFDHFLLIKILDLFLKSHEQASTQASIEVEYEHSVKRSSLISGLQGWRSYPVKIKAHKDQHSISIRVEVQILYSSTCPCSASLARQIIQSAFEKKFEGFQTLKPKDVWDWIGQEEAICATPHSQRSLAQIEVQVDHEIFFELQNLIDDAEKALSTPVQIMAKREDEKEFSRLNGENLMFCEDAARRLKKMLLEKNFIDFKGQVEHFESLHPHDAVAMFTKGVSHGFKI